ncbi:MAG: hypothetical protein RDV48_23400 [Candidatus Eremiobacteraeota bacterium]|nr:hypothetical protein [Candidatus Eremiobacteraeota bacterium]
MMNGISDRRHRQHGVNVIATILMLIAFFIVIGFAICAMSTLNLNLASRSVMTVKANQLAEAAVAQVIYYVEGKTNEIGTNMRIDNLTLPPLVLSTYYDGHRMVLDGRENEYMGGNCVVDVHFVDLSSPSYGKDRYYSTDNSSGSVVVTGSQGNVPPFTIDTIVTVKLGNLTRHYQVWLNRKWEYVLYTENVPVHLVSSVQRGHPGNLLGSSRIEGNIYSRFNPLTSGPHPAYILADMQVDESGATITTYVNNFMPGKTYPAAVTVGSSLWTQTDTGMGVPSDPILFAQSADNLFDGSAELSYQAPSVNPHPDVHVYPNNNADKVKASRFNVPVTFKFDDLMLADGSEATHFVNESTYPSALEKVDDYYGLELNTADGVYPETIEGTFPPGGSEPADLVAFRQRYNMRKIDYTSKVNEKYFLKESLDLTSPVVPGQDMMQWDDSAKFYVGDSGSGSIPLRDCYHEAVISELEETDTPTLEGGIPMTRRTLRYEVTHEVHHTDGAEISFDNSMIMTDSHIEMSSTNLKGDNCLLQCRGDIFLNSGAVTAGTLVGTAMYCNSIYCRSSGSYNGIMFVKNHIGIGNMDTSHYLTLRGGIVVRGPDAGSGSASLTTGSEGVICYGFNLAYDPVFLRFLNRFAPLRIVSWRQLD